jgi:excisionase family DNA binding protein
MLPEPTLSTAEAAAELGVCAQTVRVWLQRGDLEGHREGTRPVWRVTRASLDACRLQHPRRARSSIEPGELERLVDAVERLTTQRHDSERLIAALERERDRHRADATAVRGAAMQLNIAAGDVRDGVVKLLDVLARQSDALTQLLAPASLQDLAE